MSEEDVSRVLMAIAHLQGMWDGEMRIPSPLRPLLVQYVEGHWALNTRGYPVPSRELLAEIEGLLRREK